jgi:DNA-binding response OmpR family regulator
MEAYTLLVIARTQSLAKRLRTALDVEQYVIRWVPSAAQALGLRLSPSLVLLDLPPSGGGRSVVWLKRRFDVPLLVISRPQQPIPRPADAAVVRPYRVEELAELIEITLLMQSPNSIHAAGMSLDRDTRRLQINGTLFQLRPIGCRILALLMRRAGQTVSREELFRRVWRTDDGDRTRALDVHIAYLRRQLEADPRHPTLIVTERGVGYRLTPPGEAS